MCHTCMHELNITICSAQYVYCKKILCHNNSGVVRLIISIVLHSVLLPSQLIFAEMLNYCIVFLFAGKNSPGKTIVEGNNVNMRTLNSFSQCVATITFSYIQNQRHRDPAPRNNTRPTLKSGSRVWWKENYLLFTTNQSSFRCPGRLIWKTPLPCYSTLNTAWSALSSILCMDTCRNLGLYHLQYNLWQGFSKKDHLILGTTKMVCFINPSLLEQFGPCRNIDNERSDTQAANVTRNGRRTNRTINTLA